MAWLRNLKKAPLEPFAIISGGRLQNGCTLSGSGMSQQSTYVQSQRTSSYNGGYINLPKTLTGYTALEVYGRVGSTSDVCIPRVSVTSDSDFVAFPSNSTTVVKRTLALDPTASYNSIHCTIYNNTGSGRFTEMTLIP